MKRLLFSIFFTLVVTACSQKVQLTHCPSHINTNLQNSALEVMRNMHVRGIVLVIDSASNVVVNAGVQDSIEMTDSTHYGWLSKMLNPGNIFRPMLLASIMDIDSGKIIFLEKEYRCGRISIDNVEIADHGNPYEANGKMNVKSAIQKGSNAAWCDFCYDVYPDNNSRVSLAGILSKMLPRCVPFNINGLIYQNTQDFFRLCTGYGVLLQPYTIALYYNSLVSQGQYRLIEEDCSYRYESVVRAETAERVVDLLADQTTERVGVHGIMMDTASRYPSYVGFSSDLKHTILVMLDESFNTSAAKRIYDTISKKL
ncbi:MAG: hypothetical protein K6D59_11295 [Bacteroidales bacterium]|nr:hypothetical protein [Bacteroidales bacterium]